jgi:hypothetical protein
MTADNPEVRKLMRDMVLVGYMLNGKPLPFHLSDEEAFFAA